MNERSPPDRLRIITEALELEPILRSCLFRYVSNASDVEELVQETYAHVLALSDLPTDLRSVKGYVLTIARNLALDLKRHRAVASIECRADLEILGNVDEGEDTEGWVDSIQQLKLLVQAVEALPPRCRHAFILRKVYGYSQKEIAACLKISENTVEQHLMKAIRLLSCDPSLMPAREGICLQNPIRRKRKARTAAPDPSSPGWEQPDFAGAT